MQDEACIEELLELDLLTLREHTEAAGDRLDRHSHAESLRRSVQASTLCCVRRTRALVAYAMLARSTGASWFIPAFNIHPEWRNAAVIGELLGQVARMLIREGATDVSSHVYKTNRQSLAFHRRLGFRVVEENDKAVAFFATVDEIAGAPVIRQLMRRHAPTM